jgi:hypothetical protein
LGFFFEQSRQVTFGVLLGVFRRKKVRRAAREWHEQNFKLDVSFQRFRFRA